jgi:hypothetical protein
MWQFPRLSTWTLRALSFPVLMICAAGVGAQTGPPPTATEAQTIQKCHDATTKINNLIAASIQARTTAAALAAQIQSLTSDTSPTAAQTFTALAAAVRKLADAGLPAALADNKTALTTQKDELTKVCGADVTVPQELIDAQTAAKTASFNADTEVNTLATSNVTTSVNAALDGIPVVASQIFDSLSGKIADLKNLPAASDKQPLADGDQHTLTRGLPALTDVLEQMYDANPAWARLAKSDALKSVAAPKTTVADAQTKAKGVDSDLKAISTNLAGWIIALSLSSADPKKKGAAAVTSVLLDPGANSGEATAAQKDANQVLARINVVLGVWPRLSVALKEQPTINTDDLANNIATLSADGRSLQMLVARIADALVGDPSRFTEEAVSLFFYTEVEKLMRSLNESIYWAGGNSTAATVAASQRELLLDAESRVTQTRGEVADLQFELAKLQEQQRQADAATSFLGLQSQKASEIKKLTDSDLGRSTEEFNQAQAESNADPTNAAKKARLQKATEKKNTATAKATDAATKESDAQSKEKDARAQQTAASADKDSLSARIDLAKTKLGDAQRNMEEMQRSAYRAALTESDAFAASRDQTPYLEAPALSVSLDPVKRVIMRGYPDRNLILLRGKPDDIAVVKRIIADFDVPAPQARLTLWSFEISAELSKGFLWFRKPADRLNDATAIVDQSLGVARGEINGATTSLRQSVNDAVSKVDTGETSAPSSCTQFENTQPTPEGLISSEQSRWRRFLFYSPAVLIQAGVNMASADSFRNAVLPDPAATTTVGEALMILALSCRKNRKSVFDEFKTMTRKVTEDSRKYRSSLSEATSGKGSEDTSEYKKKPPQPCFLGTAQVLQVSTECATEKETTSDEDNKLAQDRKDLEARENKLAKERMNFHRDSSVATDECRNQVKECQAKLDVSLAQPSTEPCRDPNTDADAGLVKGEETYAPSVASEGITDTQLEIVRALRAGATKKVLHDMENLRKLIEKMENDYHDFKSKISHPKPSDAEILTCMVKVPEIESLYSRYNRLVNTRLRTLYPNDFSNFQLLSGREDFAGRAKIQSTESWQKLVEAGPRVAAADEMLKRMMGRLEDDLDQQYIQPMLRDLRRELVNEKLTVGIVQRTSVLATNRLKARVDPKGMYDLSVGEQQDLLASVGQLASIYMSAQTGGALAAFGSLNSLNQKQEQHIYGVTTGNKFEVTPIFDPSGQALRFKFDYVSNSLIRNPKGTVDPSMPSLRHTVNTEVQLSNLEIREISRYESNAKLGIPTRYYGGIPLLTDIPGLKPIPLIGWFVRRGGSNAEVQQSVIFGQTTIYPTIGSIVDLLQTGN